MPDDQMGRDRDLVLPPNTYAFVLDATKGKVSVYVGPYKNSLSNTDRLVRWREGRFVETGDMASAISMFSTAKEGQYTVLSNPARDNATPPEGVSTEAVKLEVGREVNVPGPATFALWPGQVAQTIDGHHLRHNQYLIVRVYDVAQAQANWQRAVVAPQPGEVIPTLTDVPALTMGQLIVVKGTDVSFYIPPTGIQVVQDRETGQYVREAVTLERLEYCILLDENGEKRYVQGPDVVFPSPTEKFVMSGDPAKPGETPRSDRSRKFTAIELNDHSGLYVKVIADYTDDDRTEHKAGEELFITGKDTPIYFPRAEHSIIEYGGRKKHHAIAIPAGEGRYVLNRDTGAVDLIQGPLMFLADPRTQVIVLRVLSDRLSELLYPGNKEVKEVNDSYRQISAAAGSRGLLRAAKGADTGQETYGNVALASTAAAEYASTAYAGESFARSTTYTPPRSITLDTKFDGAVAVNIWPGYAILVTDKSGGRRVEQGPKMVLLEYDEIVMPVELSSGTPKTDASLIRTAYLRVGNNHVSDRVTVETRDLVKLELSLSYRVNFEGDDPLKWFDVENYVKVMTDHARSRLRAAAKHYGIQEFYTNTIDIVRDTLLGPAVEIMGRLGLVFDENGMRVYDVEVLNVTILNQEVAALLVRAQSDALAGAVELTIAEGRSERTARIEELKRIGADESELTAVKLSELSMAGLARSTERQLADTAARLALAVEAVRVQEQALLSERLAAGQAIELERERDEVRIAALIAETSEFIRRVAAVDTNLVAALQNFGDKSFVESLVTAVGPAAIAAGVTTADILKGVFAETPFAGALNMLSERPLARASNGGRE